MGGVYVGEFYIEFFIIINWILYIFLKILMSKILIDNVIMLLFEILSILFDIFLLKKCDFY